MDKLKFETPDMVAGNIEKIGALFPAAVTEMRGEDGQVKKGINFEVLKQLLSRDVVDGDECYEFTWVGKKAAMAEAARPITKTLRPVKEDSRDWDTTQNLYIEGDNLEVLKILQESYLGKVKTIYIDPPYNTGHDFIYRDKFQRSQQEENEQMGMYDEDENQMFENTESNGRFHSDWCSYIYRPLVLARNLLSNDGLIFISIDDNEQENLKKICDEIFSESNFLTCVTRATGTPTGGGFDGLVNELDYMLIYAKDIHNAYINGLPMSEEDAKIYDQVDEKGRYLIRPLRRTGGEDRREDRPTMYFPIIAPDGTSVYPIGPTGYESRWICSPETAQKMADEGLLAWKKIKKQDEEVWQVYQKFYLENRTKAPGNLWNDVEGNKKATRDIRNIFDRQKVFDFSKPTGFIKKVLQIGSDSDCLVLDFFSGSATTAHAVMQLNSEDGGHRKFIMVQLPEPCAEGTEAANAGFKNICEIGKERIRRAGDKIKADNPLGTQDLDTGFRVFRVDSSNMKDVYYQPEELDQQSIFNLVSNIKDDRTDLDLLYACLLDWGVEIHLPHTSSNLDGCTVHNVDNGALMACFSPNVPRSVVEYMAKQQPLRAVFRDSAFASDDAKINVTEIFKNLSPDTKVKVI